MKNNNNIDILKCDSRLEREYVAIPEKTFDLIDAGYLNDKGIDVEYRNAFNRSKKELKSEVKRQEVIKQESMVKVTDLESTIRTNEMKKSELTASLRGFIDEGDEAKNSQQIEKLGLEVDQLTAQNDAFIAEQNDARDMVNNCAETVNMLNSIITGTKTNPDQLVRKAKAYQGGFVEDVKDKIPRANEISDASEYIEMYGSKKEAE